MDVASIRRTGSGGGLAGGRRLGAALGKDACEPVEELPVVERLPHEEVGPSAEGLALVVAEGAGGERTDRRRRPIGPQPANGLEAIHPGHPQVHEHDVGMPRGVDRQRGRSVGGGARLSESIVRQQQLRDELSVDGRIVDDEHLPPCRRDRQRRVQGGGAGSRARSAPTHFATNVSLNLLPAPGALSTLMSPPMSRA